MKANNGRRGKSSPEVSSRALYRHLTDTGAYHLIGGHQPPRDESSPRKIGSELRFGNRISGDNSGGVVGSPGNGSGAD
jgi:hypothetical protein